MLTKDWGDLKKTDAVNYHGLKWKLTPGRVQRDVQKNVDKLEPMEVPTEQTTPQPETSFRHTSVGQRATFCHNLHVPLAKQHRSHSCRRDRTEQAGDQSENAKCSLTWRVVNMVGRKDAVGSQRSGLGNLVAKHPPFPLISSPLCLGLKVPQKIPLFRK